MATKPRKKPEPYVLPTRSRSSAKPSILSIRGWASRGRSLSGKRALPNRIGPTACNHAKRGITSVQKHSIDFIKVACGISAL